MPIKREHTPTPACKTNEKTMTIFERLEQLEKRDATAASATKVESDSPPSRTPKRAKPNIAKGKSTNSSPSASDTSDTTGLSPRGQYFMMVFEKGLATVNKDEVAQQVRV